MFSSTYGDPVNPAEADLFTQFAGDTDPDGMGNFFSGAHRPGLQPGIDGFGPGDYSGNYTGQGDSIYWGPFGDTSSTDASTAQHSVNDNVPVQFGPGFLVSEVHNAFDGSRSVTQAGTDGTAPSGDGGVDAPGGGGLPEMPNIDALPAVPEVPSTGSVGSVAPTDTSYNTGTQRTGMSTQQTGSTPRTGSAASTIDDGVFSRAAGNSGVAGGIAEDIEYQLGSGTESTVQPGDIELQPIQQSTHDAAGIFQRQYLDGPGDLAPPDMIAREFGISRELAMGSKYENLRTALQAEYDNYLLYDGDSYAGTVYTEPSFDWTADGPDLPGGGEIEMQALNPAESSAEPSIVSEQRPTPLADKPLTITDSDGAPMLLEDLPGYSENAFSWEMLGDDIANHPEFAASLSEGLSNPEALSLGAAGVGSDLGYMSRFLRNRGIDMVTGQLLMPLFNWIDDATDSPWTSRTIQGTLAVYGLLAAGDPFGVIAAPIAWGIQEYERQRQRLIENNDPEAERGYKFGYVREGDKWYPAIQTSKTRDEGWLGSNKTQVSFAYGTEIKWKMDKTGKYYPYFEEGTYRSKNFHVWDSEVDEPEREGSEDYQKRADPLRNFYYLSDADTAAYLKNMMGGDTVFNAEAGHTFTEEEQAQIQAAQKAGYEMFGSNVKDDESWNDYWANHADPTEANHYQQYGAYVDQLQDIRESLDFMHSYRYSDTGSIWATDHTTDQFSASSEFRDIVNRTRLANPSWDNTKQVCNPMMGCVDKGFDYVDQGSRMSGTDVQMQQNGLNTYHENDELRWLSNTFYKELDQLYKAQKAAGNSMHFDKIFGGRMGDLDGPSQSSTDIRYRGTDSKALAESAWGLYQDNAWGFGSLDTTDELKQALAKIEASGDDEYMGTDHYRNAQQRNYLAQKAYCRYLFSKINAMGGYDYTFGHKTASGTTLMDKTRDAIADLSGPSYWKDQDDRYVPDWSLKPAMGLDPLFSLLDDGDDWAGARKYGTDMLEHRDEWEDENYTNHASLGDTEGRYGQDTELYDTLVRAGVITYDGEFNPDYVAGGYRSNLDFYAGIDREAMPWDPVKQEYVQMGDQTPGLIFNDSTFAYEVPDGWEPPAKDLPTLDPEDETDPNAWGWGDGTWDTTVDADDMPEIPGGFTYRPDEGAVYAPDGTRFEYPHQITEAWLYLETLENQTDENKAAADAAISGQQTVPDAHPGGTAPHEDAVDPAGPPQDTSQDRPVYHSYPVGQHPVQHFAHDATAPEHIPTGALGATKTV